MIADNINIVSEKIAERCDNIGRKLSEITVVAVSKTNPLSAIREAFSAGLTNFGENKAQELRDKNSELELNVNWHFIGHLQTNKVKYVIEPSTLIHSVDSTKLADEINTRAELIGKVQNILLEVNTSGEVSKFGLQNEAEVIEITDYINTLKNVNLKGLMTMAPYTADVNEIRKCFVGLWNLKDKLVKIGYNLSDLSMGMTNDYEIAIEEGSTILRIGSAIFGERNYKGK